MSLVRWLTGLLFIAAVSHISGTASAQTDNTQEGRAAFSAGAAAYGEGRFADAMELFQRSYELTERPALLFNIGQCHDRLRNDRQAISSFESFLALVPESDNRRVVMERLRILRVRVAESEASGERVRNAEERALDAERDRQDAERERVSAERDRADAVLRANLAERPPLVRQWWFWTLLGAVVAGTVVGVVVATRDPGVQPATPGDIGGVIIALGAQ